MIVHLEGMVVEHDGSIVVISCGGVGYGVIVCPDDQGIMKIGDSVSLYISENIKEDTYDLYGFREKTRRELYRQLTSVNGVGPKAGMAILAIGAENHIRKAIAQGDTAFLSRASGVGKKVAERVVVDLKNKVGMLPSSDATDFLHEDIIGDNDEAVQALVALGYTLSDAKVALKDIDNDLDLQARVSLVLKGSR
jgi:Holliday junction DNA helicase RuvA